LVETLSAKSTNASVFCAKKIGGQIMSKLRTLIVGREFRCKSCSTVFKPDPNDPRCPSCGKRFGEDEAIRELEKSPDRIVDV